MQGDIWLSRNHKKGERLFGWAIRWTPSWARGKWKMERWNHVMVEARDGRLVSAEGKGVRMRTAPEYSESPDKSAVTIRADGWSDAQRKAVAVAAEEHLGLKYSWRGIVGQGIRKLGGYRKWSRRVAEFFGGTDKAVYCSELAAEASLAGAGYLPMAWRTTERITPGGVAPRAGRC